MNKKDITGWYRVPKSNIMRKQKMNLLKILEKIWTWEDRLMDHWMKRRLFMLIPSISMILRNWGRLYQKI